MTTINGYAARDAEIAVLREQVLALTKDLKTQTEALEQVSTERYTLRAQVETLTEERDEARAQVATARTNALEEAAQVSDFSADDASGSGFTSDPDDEEGRKMWALVEERHRQDAKAVRALATTPPPPVVPVAKVREVLRKASATLARQGYGSGIIRDISRGLGISLDGEP